MANYLLDTDGYHIKGTNRQWQTETNEEMTLICVNSLMLIKGVL